MNHNNAVRTIEDVAIKLKRIESQMQLYQKELQRMLDAKGEGSERVINKWTKEINDIIKVLEKVEAKKLEIIKAMTDFVAKKFKFELEQQKENDKWRRSPLLKRSGKDKGAIDL